jgi:small-conductance mechanosensitive channel
MTWRRCFLLTIVLLAASAAAWAQAPSQAAGAPETNYQARIAQITDRLDAGDVPDAVLEANFRALTEYQRQLDDQTQSLTDELETPTSRLKVLGPPPAEGAPPESDDVAALRKNLNDEISRLTGLLKQAELDRDAIQQLIKRIGGLQESRFLQQLITRDASPFSSRFWTDAADDIDPALNAFKNHLIEWRQEQQASGKLPGNIAVLVAALAAAIAVILSPRWSRWRAFETARHANPTPSALDKRRRVAFMAISRGLVAAAAGALLYAAAVSVDLVVDANQVFALRIWIAFAALVLVWNFARELFSPREERWRTLALGSKAARPLFWLCFAVFCLYAFDRVVAAGFKSAGAGPQFPLTLSTIAGSLSAVLLWVFIGLSQRLLDAKDKPPTPVAAPEPKSDSAPPAAIAPRKPKHPWRDLVFSCGRLLATLILATNALSYVALSGFVFHRFVLLMLFLILFYSVRIVTLWALSALPFVAQTPADTTEHDQEKRRLGLWLRASVDIALVTLGVPALVFVVGFGWLKMQSIFGLLNSSVEVGAVSVSFGNILAAVLVFLAISIGTRLATSITDKKILSRTRLDPGERNSIVMLIKYAGIVVALLAAFAFAGVSLSKLAIVAGGLSVGIGLGLQGVVNNFVSGLILLFERPIKLGDWIKVSSGEGYVKHIGARATEIETFERASIIIPNADLVTSAVQNWFHKNRIGRIQVGVGVSYNADPEQVRAILLDCARKNASVMNSPPAFVIWKDFGDSSLDFELRAYIWNFDNSLQVRSDLRFAIFKALKDAGIEIPFPQRDLHIRSDSTKGGNASD